MFYNAYKYKSRSNFYPLLLDCTKWKKAYINLFTECDEDSCLSSALCSIVLKDFIPFMFINSIESYF